MVRYSLYKNWLDKCNISFYKEMESIFQQEPIKDKRANRIYLKTNIRPEYTLNKIIKDFLEEKGYEVIDEIKGTCSLKTTLPKKQTLKIGKVLTKLKNDSLLKLYTNERSFLIKNTENLCIVISRHPYDLIGMSTDRNWTTCHDLYDKTYNGKYLYQLGDMLKGGVLIAYLIRDTDKNITNPLSRTIIYKNLKPHNLLYSETAYGMQSKSFLLEVNKWLDKICLNKIN